MKNEEVQENLIDTEVFVGDIVTDLRTGNECEVLNSLSSGAIIALDEDGEEVFIAYGQYAVAQPTNFELINKYETLVDFSLSINDKEMFNEYATKLQQLRQTPSQVHALIEEDIKKRAVEEEEEGKPVGKSLPKPTEQELASIMVELSLQTRNKKDFIKYTRKLGDNNGKSKL